MRYDFPRFAAKIKTVFPNQNFFRANLEKALCDSPTKQILFCKNKKAVTTVTAFKFN
jgi:hypothetical protein